MLGENSIMSEIVTTDVTWQFGYYANAPVEATIFEDGERKNVTLTVGDIQEADSQIDPWEVLAALDNAADVVQYQIAGVTYSKEKIAEFVEDESLTITTSGSILFKEGNNSAVEYSTDEIGFEVHKLLIEKLQTEINEINDLIVDLQKLQNLLLVNDDIEKKGVEKVNLEHYDSNESDKPFWDKLREELPNLEGAQLRNFVKDSNNDYIKWAEIDADQYSSNTEDYRFGTTILGDFCDMAFEANDMSNAIETLNNKVKQRTTQVEQLGTDLQSNTSQYNSLMEAMSNYYSTYFDATKSLLTGA
jgi:hypothetical protein